MRTDQEQRVRVAVRALAEAAPVVAPPAAAVRARGQARPSLPASRPWVPALTAAGVFALVVAIALLPGLLRPTSVAKPIMAGDPAVLPPTLAGPTPDTADYLESPPGRVIAQYHLVRHHPDDPEGDELSGTLDWVLVGADGRTYRQGGQQGWPHGALLSPDGLHLAIGDGDVADLTTGQVTAEEQVHGTVMAWSPDSRRLVIGMFGPSLDAVFSGVYMMDLATDRVIFLRSALTPLGAAFSPDGQLLVVQDSPTGGAVETTLSFYDLEGELVRTMPAPASHRLAGTAAWSPDGELLVLEPGTPDETPRELTFLDASGSGRSVPEAIGLPASKSVLLGWRSPDTMLVGMDDGTARGLNLIAEVPVDGGDPRTVSRISVPERGRVAHLHVATGLLPAMEIRDAGPPLREP